MAIRSIDGVRQERTGWRDQEISQRHREWGFNCPAVDLDFLVVEYNLGLPVAIVEYKHYLARRPEVRHATYRALSALGARIDGEWQSLPFFVAFYWPEMWAFRVYPVNAAAGGWFTTGVLLSEYDYVLRLYRLRRLVLSESLESKLNRNLPAGYG